MVSRGDCAMINVPETAQPGQIIEVCYTATIGNPDNPDAICDQASLCTEFVVEPIMAELGDTTLICFEDQPYTWHGQVITVFLYFSSLYGTSSSGAGCLLRRLC